eukprot:963421-Rhodomonas_salina.1
MRSVTADIDATESHCDSIDTQRRSRGQHTPRAAHCPPQQPGLALHFAWHAAAMRKLASASAE